MSRLGDRLRAMAALVCGAATMERVIDPAIADLQCEYDDAIRRGRLWRGRWIRVAGYVGFWKAIGIQAIGAGVRAAHEWAAAEEWAIGRTIAFSTAAMGAITLAIAMAAFYQLSIRFGIGRTGRLLLYLIPQSIPTAILLGLPLGILWGLRGRVASNHVRRTVMAGAIVCSFAAFLTCMWILPRANQAFRELAGGNRVVMKGANELTLPELSVRIDELNRQRSSRVLPYALSYHMRWMGSVAPVVFGVFALALSQLTRRALISISIFAALIAANVMYSVFFVVVLWRGESKWLQMLWRGQNEWLPLVAALWLPTIVVAILSAILLRRAQLSRLSRVL